MNTINYKKNRDYSDDVIPNVKRDEQATKAELYINKEDSDRLHFKNLERETKRVALFEDIVPPEPIENLEIPGTLEVDGLSTFNNDIVLTDGYRVVGGEPIGEAEEINILSLGDSLNEDTSWLIGEASSTTASLAYNGSSTQLVSNDGGISINSNDGGMNITSNLLITLAANEIIQAQVTPTGLAVSILEEINPSDGVRFANNLMLEGASDSIIADENLYIAESSNNNYLDINGADNKIELYSTDGTKESFIQANYTGGLNLRANDGTGNSSQIILFGDDTGISISTNNGGDIKISPDAAFYVLVENLPTYADEAAAVIGGVPQNAIYTTATGELRRKL